MEKTIRAYRNVLNCTPKLNSCYPIIILLFKQHANKTEKFLFIYKLVEQISFLLAERNEDTDCIILSAKDIK